MRNLPAFSRVRKVAALALWGGGAAAWAILLWGRLAGERPPDPVVEARGADLGPLWADSCPPVVASRRGKRYYWAWCEGAGALSPASTVHFCGPEAAERAGYTLAKGCGGEGEGAAGPPPKNP